MCFVGCRISSFFVFCWRKTTNIDKKTYITIYYTFKKQITKNEHFQRIHHNYSYSVFYPMSFLCAASNACKQVNQ